MRINVCDRKSPPGLTQTDRWRTSLPLRGFIDLVHIKKKHTSVSSHPVRVDLFSAQIQIVTDVRRETEIYTSPSCC